MADLPVDYASHPQSSMNSGSSSPLIGHDQLEVDTNTSLASASHISHIPPREIFSLTDIGNGGPAATEVAEYLVQAVGRDVVSFRRNTQVSYLAVERARDIVKAINEYIAKVEESTTGDWDSFEKFTTAIEPLEDILLTLLAFTEDEKARYFANIDSINDCVSSTESWAHNRKELSKALGGFDTRQELKELFNEPNTELRQREHEEAQSYDDITLLEEMRTTLKAFIYEDLNRFPPYVRHVETSLDLLQTAVIDGLTPEWLTVITIQTSMLIEGIVEMVKVVTLDTDTLNHLKSKPVWTAASELIDVLSLNKTQADLPHSAKEKYDAFVQALLTMGELSLPESYVELMKQVGRIRRPFQAQAVALVMLCRFLADNFKAIGKSAVTVENVNSLDAAFDQTLATLQAATKAVTDLRAFDLTNFTSHATVQAFVGAEALIQESFKSFNLNAEWAQRRSELSAAVNKDMKRMEKLNDMLSRSPSSTTAKVRVNVTIHDKSINGMKLGATSVEGETTMRLLALRWSASGALEQEEIKRAARTAGTFFKRTQDGWSKMAASHSTLAEIVDGESEVTLKLVVA